MRMFSRKTPVILQTEMTECGLACLAMIARHHGHDIDLNVLRTRHLVSARGASLRSLMKIADGLSLSSRALRVDLEQLGNIGLPAILHWDLNHFVVLEKVSGNKVTIIDPGVGLRVLPLSRVSKHFTGVALELAPKAEFVPLTARLKPKLSLLWSKLTGVARAGAQLLILSIVLQAALLLSPFFLQLSVDTVLPSGDQNLLWLMALGFGALAILRASAEAVRGWLIVTFGNQMSLQMVGNVFAHMIRLPTTYFEKRHVGDIISRMSSTKPIQEALSQSVVGVIIDGAMAALTLAVMFAYSPVLAVIVLGFTLVLFLAQLLIYPHLRRTQEEAIYAKALENTHVIESIRANMTVKLLGREVEREAAWRNLYTDFINANMGHGRFTVAKQFVTTLVQGLQLICVIYAAVRMMMGGADFTVGMLLAFTAYLQYFSVAIAQLIEKGIEFRLLSLHLDRLSDIIFERPEHARAGINLSSNFKGEVRIDGVNFRYSDDDPDVISNVDLTIEAGSMVTITGPSGGGKTTLMKLMLGLYRPQSGRILIDGQDLTEIDLADWRSRIGVVMQDDRLLSGTIADNISFFDPHLDMQRVARAAHKAQIHETISALPMHYNSMVGDMGSILSGGQKQRLLLARALYSEPDVLFLDEGTANLDVRTEGLIVNIIRDLPITRIIIAHRPAFLAASDRVITL